MNGNLSLDELYAAANELCRKHWGVNYTGTIRLTNAKWRRKIAGFRFENYGASTYIVMSTVVNAELTREEVSGYLLHELVHWRLFTSTLREHGFERAHSVASDDSPEFVRECIRVGAPFSHTDKAQRAAQIYGGKREVAEC